MTSNANADMKFAVGDELEGAETNTTILPWRTWLWVADAALWSLSVAGIALSAVLFFKGKKDAQNA